ncbi:TPA: hypothetical protein DDW35_06845, partial [Candidatus Sumerlaeota bacterium]|nr:hypothetical protein [Candidatus Sumerlaeota bacterium]
HEASGRVFDARMVIKCILNQANSMLINYLSSSNASPLVKTAWTEEVLDFEGASKGVMDLLAALERDLCEASESAKTGGIGFLKPYFNSGVLRVEADETYAKYGAPQVRACGVMG